MSRARQQFRRGHGIGAAAIRGAAQAVAQILDPDDARHGRAVPERPLVGKDQVDPFRAGGDDAGGPPEMPRSVH